MRHLRERGGHRVPTHPDIDVGRDIASAAGIFVLKPRPSDVCVLLIHYNVEIDKVSPQFVRHQQAAWAGPDDDDPQPSRRMNRCCRRHAHALALG